MIDNAAEVLLRIKEVKDFDLKIKLIALANLGENRKQLDKLQEDEIRLIEKKYNQLSLPIFQSTNDIVNGIRVVQEVEITKLDDFLTEQEKVNKEQYVKNQDPIQGYWLKVLKNAQPLQEDIKPKDEPILIALKTIEAESDAQNDDFTLIFTFDQNDYFTNDILKIKFFIRNEQDIYKTESTQINWKEGKDITKKIVKKKKNKKIKVKEVEQESFFNLFRNIDTQSEQFKALPKEQISEQEYKLGVQFEIGSIIFDEIIPFSLEYFLGVRVEDELDEQDDDDEDEEDIDSNEDISKEEAIERMKARFKPKTKK